MNRTLMIDQYQLTMAKAYQNPISGLQDTEACFEYFFRSYPRGWQYLITCGLEQVIDYILNFSLPKIGIEKLNISMKAVPEGRDVFPDMPIIQITGPIAHCQVIETYLLNAMNYQSLVATKANTIINAANGKPVMEFGLRRAQADGGNLGSRAAYIGGCCGTSNVFAGKEYGIPVMGTHAHSWVMAHEDEQEAFYNWAQIYPDNCCLLLDTYDTIKAIDKAIKAFKKYKIKNPKVRLDSGNLLELSLQCFHKFKAANLDVKIIASNDLDEHKIGKLEEFRSPIDIYACGTNLITVSNSPALGGVYKLVAIRKKGSKIWIPKEKNSDSSSKKTKGGIKENQSMVQIFEAGELVYSIPSIQEIRGTRN